MNKNPFLSIFRYKNQYKSCIIILYSLLGGLHGVLNWEECHTCVRTAKDEKIRGDSR